MTLSDLANIGSFVSGIAVLASLIFVGFQLRQNTQAVRATSSQAQSAIWQQILNPIIEHDELAGIWRQGIADIRSLTDNERIRFIMLASELFRSWEGARLQWRHGQLDTEHWHNVEGLVTDFASQPGIQVYWKMRRQWYSAEFQKWFEGLDSQKARYPYDLPSDD